MTRSEEWLDIYNTFHKEIQEGWSGSCGEMVTADDIERAATIKTNEIMDSRQERAVANDRIIQNIG
jgi:hypothetical protein